MTKEVALATLHEAAGALLGLAELRRLYSDVVDIPELEQLHSTLDRELTNALVACGDEHLQNIAMQFSDRNDIDDLTALSCLSFLAIVSSDIDPIRIGAPIEEVVQPVWDAEELACDVVRHATWRVHYIQYNNAIVPSFADLTAHDTLQRARTMLQIYSVLAREFEDAELYTNVGLFGDELALTYTYVALRVIRYSLLLPDAREDEHKRVVVAFAMTVKDIAATENSRRVAAIGGLPYLRRMLDLSDTLTAQAAPLLPELTLAERFFLAEVRRDLRARYEELDEADELSGPLTPETVLALCAAGENDRVEFKSERVDLPKLVKEVVAMLNTATSGVILVGVEDDGTITGFSRPRDAFDQSLQNSIRANVLPSPAVRLEVVAVNGANVAAIRIPSWNRRDVYQFDHRIYIRKGTNAFVATPDEARELYFGRAIT